MTGTPASLETQRRRPDGRMPPSVSGRSTTLLLIGAVALSTCCYGLLSGGTKGPWILPDELAYGELARSFASTGHFALRGVHTLLYPPGYPALLSPAFAGRGPVAAYEAAKWVNAALMSLTAIPVFLIARRLLSARAALLAVLLTLLVPSMAYTRVLMSENGFFLIFMLAMLAFVRVVEAPTSRRQIVALAAIVPVVGTRSEGLIVVPILVLAIVLQALTGTDRQGGGYTGRVGSELWRYRTIGFTLPAAVLVLVGAEAAVGRSPTAVLGRYSSSIRTYPLVSTLRWAVYQVVDIEFYVAVIPIVAAVLVVSALLTRRGTTRGERAVAAVAVPAVVIAVLAAAAASAQPGGGASSHTPYIPPEIHDRYCFWVTPFLLIFFVYWLRHRSELSTRGLVWIGLAASALPLVLPYSKVHGNADFDGLALLPWSNGLIAGRNVHYAMAVCAFLFGAVAVPRRGSIALLQVGAVGLSLVIMVSLAENEIGTASTEVPSSRLADRSWVDDSVPPSTPVAVVWIKEPGVRVSAMVRREQALFRAELFNPVVDAYFNLGARMQYDLPVGTARLRNGRLITQGAGEPTYRYVLTAGPLPALGTVVARDRRAGLLLYRLAMPSRELRS